MTSRSVLLRSLAAALLAAASVVALPAPASAACTPSSDATDGSGNRIVVFTAVGTCTFDLADSPTVSVLVVAGGGAGGSSPLNALGGGGGGGLAEGALQLTGTLTITVGDGGTGYADCTTAISGGDSSIVAGTVSITAYGGGHGAGCSEGGDGVLGGSAGGAHPWNSAKNGGTATKGSLVNAPGVTLYGNDSAAVDFGVGGGGGAGAGGAGGSTATTDGGAGGAGYSSSVTGTAVVYAAGGGGSGVNGGVGGTNAGNGGSSSAAASAGTDGTGAGGGGASTGVGGGKDGGSGIVVLKFASATDPITLVSTYLDAPREEPQRNFLTARLGEMQAGKCSGSSTSFLATLKGMVQRQMLTADEVSALTAAVRSICP